MYTQCNSTPPLITYYIILAISISPDASHRMYYNAAVYIYYTELYIYCKIKDAVETDAASPGLLETALMARAGSSV